MVLNEGGDYQKMIMGFDTPGESQPVITDTPIRFSWVHRHPYLASAIAIFGLLLLGAGLVMHRTDVDPARSSDAWGGAGGLVFANLRAQAPYRPSAEDITYLQSSAQTVPFVPIPTQEHNDQTGGERETSNDLTALLALLATPPTTASETEVSTSDAYAFIPQGLITTVTSHESRTVTPGSGSSLREYGNQIGTYIKDFEATHSLGAQILKDHVEDRSNPQKISALERLAFDMQEFGRSLIEMDYVPAAAAGMHKAYANAYRAVGFALQDVAKTTTDEAFVEAITFYNAAVEELTKRFLMLVALFAANNITFSSSDPGSVFMFNANVSGL